MDMERRIMRRTNELRFIEREERVPHPDYESVEMCTIKRVLQQRWISGTLDEWRDVPIFKDLLSGTP
jgi:hypothetical protein